VSQSSSSSSSRENTFESDDVMSDHSKCILKCFTKNQGLIQQDLGTNHFENKKTEEFEAGDTFVDEK
jgi:hypothetical protein